MGLASSFGKPLDRMATLYLTPSRFQVCYLWPHPQSQGGNHVSYRRLPQSWQTLRKTAVSTQLSADITCEHSTNNPNPNPNSLPNMPFHPSSGNITLLLWGLGLPPPTVVQVGAANPATWVIDTSRADRGASLTSIAMATTPRNGHVTRIRTLRTPLRGFKI